MLNVEQLKTLVKAIEIITEQTGKAFSWLTTCLVILICLDVLLRYAFSSTRVWVIELEWHLFALLFLMAAAYTLKADQHVRVDLFYSKWSDQNKAWVNFLGTVVFLIPWCIVIIVAGFQYAENSWAFREGSPDPGGFPARYVIKFAIVAGFALLLIQAVAEAIKSLLVIRASKKP